MTHRWLYVSAATALAAALATLGPSPDRSPAAVATVIADSLTPTERRIASAVDERNAQALALLERHGVLTREAVASEGVVGGFSAAYGVLKMLEERGQIRRGYFVNGLGAAQFSLPGAVDRLRGVREGPDALHPELAQAPIILAATDPAQPYGGTLPWPDNSGRPARSAGAMVVLSGGRALAWFDRRSHHLLMFPGSAVDGCWADALATLVKDGRARSVEIRKIDGESVGTTGSVVDQLKRVGFIDGYRGLTLRQ